MIAPRTLSAAVGDFYERVLADPDLAPYFVGVDVARLREHQTTFLLTALEVGRTRQACEASLHALLERAHAGLGIDDAAFDRTVDHLHDALRDLGLSPVELVSVRDRVRRFRGAVVAP